MTTPHFAPGFRLSTLDLAVLIIGIIATAGLSAWTPSLGFIVGFVVIHFFLFCNIVRLARSLELIWSAVFLVLAASTIVQDVPSWLTTTIVSLFETAVVVLIEARKPSYHGVCWQRINPNLKEWWDAHINGSE
jgi:hypothetical protein